MSIVVDFIAGVGIDLDYAQRMMDGSGNAENRKQSKLHPSMSHRSIFLLAFQSANFTIISLLCEHEAALHFVSAWPQPPEQKQF